VSLEDILAGPGRLMARCSSARCGSTGPVTIAAAPYGTLRKASLARLSSALRCTCGARGGALSPWPLGDEPVGGAHRLFLFFG